MTERSITISEQVFEALLPLAEQENKDIEGLVNEAVQQYIWKAKERQIDREMAAYRAMHPKLKSRYLGEYVAIRQGKVVGHHQERKVLSEEIRQAYGMEAILIMPVTEEPEREWLLRSPHLERST